MSRTIKDGYEIFHNLCLLGVGKNEVTKASVAFYAGAAAALDAIGSISSSNGNGGAFSKEAFVNDIKGLYEEVEQFISDGIQL